MAWQSDTALLVLHGVRLKSCAPAAALAPLLGSPVDEAEAWLELYAGKEWVRWNNGALAGWSLTPAGRTEVDRLLAEELEASGARPVVEAAYEDFLAQNRPFLRACTDWDLRSSAGRHASPIVNDHHDRTYDSRVIAELAAIDEAVQPVCIRLADALIRFGSYGGRFAEALRRLRAGETEWFTKPVIDSYHTVWFELHEDLLATLGRQRSSERS